MKKTKITMLLHSPQAIVFGVLALAYGAVIAQEASLVEIKSYGQHVGNNIVYNYKVTNHTVHDVTAVSIGYYSDYVNIEKPFSHDDAELTAFPLGFDIFERTTPTASYVAPTGWALRVISQEETNAHFLYWSPYSEQLERIPDNSLVIETGQTFHFSVTVPKEQDTLLSGQRDQAYLTGHFVVGFGDGSPRFTAQMQLVDTTPPSLTVSLTPATLWPPNGKPVPITTTVTLKDDYDPNPEIKLESITANEPIDAAQDITDVKYGADDRHFALKAKRAGENKIGRVYTVTYSATDASGNKASASATVTVPHEQRK